MNALAGSPLPSKAALARAAYALGCVIAHCICRTHGGSLLVHDGDRIGCHAAWARALDVGEVCPVTVAATPVEAPAVEAPWI